MAPAAYILHRRQLLTDCRRFLARVVDRTSHKSDAEACLSLHSIFPFFPSRVIRDFYVSFGGDSRRSAEFLLKITERTVESFGERATNRRVQSLRSSAYQMCQLVDVPQPQIMCQIYESLFQAKRDLSAVQDRILQQYMKDLELGEAEQQQQSDAIVPIASSIHVQDSPKEQSNARNYSEHMKKIVEINYTKHKLTCNNKSNRKTVKSRWASKDHSFNFENTDIISELQLEKQKLLFKALDDDCGIMDADFRNYLFVEAENVGDSLIRELINRLRNDILNQSKSEFHIDFHFLCIRESLCLIEGCFALIRNYRAKLLRKSTLQLITGKSRLNSTKLGKITSLIVDFLKRYKIM